MAPAPNVFVLMIAESENSHYPMGAFVRFGDVVAVGRLPYAENYVWNATFFGSAADAINQWHSPGARLYPTIKTTIVEFMAV
jgi:hypothetical protein